jgi:hypothetical protein
VSPPLLLGFDYFEPYTVNIMDTTEIEKSKAHITVEIIEYLPSSVV